MLFKKMLCIICIILIFGMNIGFNCVSAVPSDENTVSLEQNNEIEQNNETFEEENCIIDSNENIIPEENVTEKEEPLESNEIKEEIPKQEDIKTQDQKSEIPTQTIKDGTYIIYTGVGNNTCLDVTAGAMGNGVNIEIWKDIREDTQKFKVKYLGDGYYKITSVKSSKSLDVAYGLSTNGTNVWQYEGNETDAQKWIIKDAGNGYFNIISKCNGLYLDVAYGLSTDGTNVQVYEGNGTNAQKFKFVLAEEFEGKQTIKDGIYYIITGVSSSKVIDIAGGQNDNSANVQIGSKSNLSRKKFLITYKGSGLYEIENINSGKMLDVEYANATNGANVSQYESNGTKAQRWVIKDLGNSYYNIISRCGGLYLDVAYGLSTEGTNIQIYEKNGTDAQKFKFEEAEFNTGKTLENGTYVITSGLDSSKALDIAEGSIYSGANLQIWDRTNVKQQKFIVTYLNNGFYRITSLKSNKVLDVDGGANVNSANVQQYITNNTRAQEWILKDLGNGYYNIISRCGGLYLDVAYGINKNGTNVQIYEGNGTKAQEFKFEEATDTDGIDVSSYQGNVDWKKVNETGIDFAFIRLGYRGYETGKFADDSKFIQNVNGCIENNIDYGIYFVTQAISYDEGVEEANYVLNKIKNYNFDCPIVIDVEDSGGNPGRADNLSKEERTDCIKGFCDTIEKNGYVPMIYSSKNWLMNKIDLSKLPNALVWLAHYVNGAPSKVSDYEGEYKYWQYTSSGKINGISGNVDLNKGY